MRYAEGANASYSESVVPVPDVSVPPADNQTQLSAGQESLTAPEIRH